MTLQRWLFVILTGLSVLITNRMFPTRHLETMRSSEFQKLSAPTKNSELAQGLESVIQGHSLPPLTVAPPQTHTIASSNEYDPTAAALSDPKLMDECEKVSLFEISTKQSCSERLFQSPEMLIEQKSRYFQNEINNADCSKAFALNECRIYLVDCLHKTLQLNPRATEVKMLLESISRQYDNSDELLPKLEIRYKAYLREN